MTDTTTQETDIERAKRLLPGVMASVCARWPEAFMGPTLCFISKEMNDEELLIVAPLLRPFLENGVSNRYSAVANSYRRMLEEFDSRNSAIM